MAIGYGSTQPPLSISVLASWASRRPSQCRDYPRGRLYEPRFLLPVISRRRYQAFPAADI